MAQDESLVEYTRDGNLGIIAFNRPEKLNAISDDVVLELSEAMHEFDMDENAWVGIIHGHGRAFSAGADVQQRQLRPQEEAAKLGGLRGRAAAAASNLFTESVNWKPVVAAVHGYCLGMALGVALECEIVIADEDAQFQLTEVGRGLGGARYVKLMQYRGLGSFATEIGMTGRFFSGKEAASNGVINSAVPSGLYLDAAREIAGEIASNPPLSVRANVRSRRWQIDQIKRSSDHETVPLKLYLTEDFHESALAFAEKRAPRPFLGR